MVAYFKIYPHILVTVYMVLPWSKFTNYSCAHEHFHYSLSKYLHNTNTESSTYSSSGELALPSLLNAVKYLFGLGAQSETWQHIYCRNLFDLNIFQICPALCCSLDSSRAPEALQSWSQVSFSWYLKNKELSPSKGWRLQCGGCLSRAMQKTPVKVTRHHHLLCIYTMYSPVTGKLGCAANCLIASTALLHSQTTLHWQQTVHNCRNKFF